VSTKDNRGSASGSQFVTASPSQHRCAGSPRTSLNRNELGYLRLSRLAHSPKGEENDDDKGRRGHDPCRHNAHRALRSLRGNACATFWFRKFRPSHLLSRNGVVSGKPQRLFLGRFTTSRGIFVPGDSCLRRSRAHQMSASHPSAARKQTLITFGEMPIAIPACRLPRRPAGQPSHAT